MGCCVLCCCVVVVVYCYHAIVYMYQYCVNAYIIFIHSSPNKVLSFPSVPNVTPSISMIPLHPVGAIEVVGREE